MLIPSTKLLWVAHESGISGATFCLLEYIEVLLEHDYEIYLIAPKSGELTKRAQTLGCKCFIVPFYHWTRDLTHSNFTSIFDAIKKKLRNELAVFEITNLIKVLHPDYVITNTITLHVAAIAAKRVKVPHIWFVHEFGEEDHGFTIVGGMHRARNKIAALSNKVVVNSQLMAKSYSQHVPLEKLFVVYYSIPITVQPKKVLPGPTLKFLILGQIASSKNQADAIEAVVHFYNKGFSCQLNIIGHVVDQEYKNQLEAMISTNSANNYIKINEPVSNVTEVLLKCDALLMCSRMEAFGRVTVEALKMGVPVIAADAGATPELVQSGINGYLYKSGDVEALEEALIKFKETYYTFDSISIANCARSRFNQVKLGEQLKVIFSKDDK